MDSNLKLNITEIYPSIQGEALYAGYPCTFIRTAGCPLRCRWCDTVYSFGEGDSLSIDSIVETVKKHGLDFVELTGGEPLAQANSLFLIKALCDQGFHTMIETGGSEDIGGVDTRCHIIMDLKAPDSQMSDKNRFENIDHLKNTDEIKIVVASKADFLWLEKLITENPKLSRRKGILVSPAYGLTDPKDLVDWMLASSVKNQLKLNLQWHKTIWHPRKKGV